MAGNRIKGITIEIDGDTQKLSDALRKVDNDLRDTQDALKDVNKLLKFDPSNVELLRQKQNLLKESVDKTKAVLDQEKEALKKLQATENPTEEMIRQQDALNREIQETERKLRNANKRLHEFGSVGIQQAAAVGKAMQTVGKKITEIGGRLTQTVTAPIMGAFALATKEASDLEENLNKVNVAFGDNAEKVTEWAETATTQFGLSKNAALEATALFGDMGTSMGLTSSDAADMAIALSGLAGDLSSFKNIDIEQAMNALKGVFTGETESLKSLGIVMNETNLKDFAESIGLVYEEMDQSEKVTLRYQYVMQAAANAQGDYARTSDGLANSLRTMKAELSNLAAAVGEELIPIVTPIVQRATELIRKFGQMDEGTKKMIVTIGLVVAAVGPLLMVFGTLMQTIGGLLKLPAMLAQGFAFLMTPIGAAVVGIAGLIAAGVLLYQHWDELKAYAVQLKDNLAASFATIRDTVIGALTTVITWVTELPAKIASGILEQIGLVASAATQLGQSVLDGLSAFFGQMKQVGADLIGKVREGISDAFLGIGDFLAGIGSSIVDGIWQGMSNAIGTFTANVKGFFSNIVSGVKNELGIQSPSKVFAYIGQMMGEGLAVGWGASMKSFNPAADIMAVTGGAALAAGGTTYGFTNNINLYGQYSERDGYNIAMSIDKWLGERI